MQEQIKLVAFDLDGTVLPMMQNYISPVFIDAAERASQLGVVFAVFSGRSMTTIPSDAYSMRCVQFISYANGGGIIELATGKCIYHSPMPQELALRTLKALEPFNLLVQVFSEGKVIYPRYALEDPERYGFPPNHMESIKKGLGLVADDLYDYVLQNNPVVDKLNITRVEGQLRAQVIERLNTLGGLDAVSSGGVNLEMNASTTNKGLALRYLAEHMGLRREQVMAIGDNDNDAAMLRWAGVGVAMGDGSQAARESADYITGPVTQEGAAAALEKLVLSQEERVTA